jgi:hypothetical protein
MSKSLSSRATLTILGLPTLFGVAPVRADMTTYVYEGEPFTTSEATSSASPLSGLCYFCGAEISDSITFDFNTSDYTGTLTASSLQFASLVGTLPSPMCHCISDIGRDHLERFSSRAMVDLRDRQHRQRAAVGAGNLIIMCVRLARH